MLIISVNVRGLGSGRKKMWIRELCRKVKPIVVRIEETKSKKCSNHQIGKLWGGETM